MRFGPVTISPSIVSPAPLVGLARRASSIGGRVSVPWPRWGERRLGKCVACQEPVYENQAFLRYRGDYYHAGLCVERDPPASRTRALLADRRLAG
jgi:hypothetical protein